MRPYKCDVLWKYRAKHEPCVTAALEARYEISGGDGLVKQLARIAVRLAEEHWDNYREDMLASVRDSFLEELDELNLGVAFKRSIAASIAYAVMSRCGLGPGDYFEPEDFRYIPDFNTVPAITQLDSVVNK